MSTEKSIATHNRIIWVDEIKGLLIFLVVFGHLTSDYSGIQASQNGLAFLRYLIYFMHMPMFIFISGYLSKGNGTIKKLIIDLFIPYVTFDILYVTINKMLGGGY